MAIRHASVVNRRIARLVVAIATCLTLTASSTGPAHAGVITFGLKARMNGRVLTSGSGEIFVSAVRMGVWGAKRGEIGGWGN